MMAHVDTQRRVVNFLMRAHALPHVIYLRLAVYKLEHTLSCVRLFNFAMRHTLDVVLYLISTLVRSTIYMHTHTLRA